MSMFQSNATAKSNTVKQASGVAAGAAITFAAVPGKAIYLDKVTGYTDADSDVEAKCALTGTLATTSGSATVTGTNTLFTTELAAGDVVKIGTSNELLTVSVTPVSDTSFTATANSGNNQSTIASNVLVGKARIVVAVNPDLGWDANGSVVGKTGKALVVTLMTSSAACFIQGGSFTLG